MLLERTAEERPVLRLNAASWTVLRGQRSVRLLQPKTAVAPTRFDEESWEGVDRGLFESLRTLRRLGFRAVHHADYDDARTCTSSASLICWYGA